MAARIILCGPPKDCTCPAVAWTCCCEASEHGRRMIAGLPCDCGVCPTPPEVPPEQVVMWVPDFDAADEIDIPYQSMRPWITCPHCHRRGAIQRRLGTKPFVVHHCPGPFVLDHVEEADYWTAGYRVTIHERR